MNSFIRLSVFIIVVILLFFTLGCKSDSSHKAKEMLDQLDKLVMRMRADNADTISISYKKEADQYISSYEDIKHLISDGEKKKFLKNAYSYVYLQYGIDGMQMLEDTSDHTMQLILDETYSMFQEGGNDFQAFILELYDENRSLLEEYQKIQLDSIEQALDQSHHNHSHDEHDHHDHSHEGHNH